MLKLETVDIRKWIRLRQVSASLDLSTALNDRCVGGLSLKTSTLEKVSWIRKSTHLCCVECDTNDVGISTLQKTNTRSYQVNGLGNLGGWVLYSLWSNLLTIQHCVTISLPSRCWIDPGGIRGHHDVAGINGGWVSAEVVVQLLRFRKWQDMWNGLKWIEMDWNGLKWIEMAVWFTKPGRLKENQLGWFGPCWC